jgi:hypothetical protein
MNNLGLLNFLTFDKPEQIRDDDIIFIRHAEGIEETPPGFAYTVNEKYRCMAAIVYPVSDKNVIAQQVQMLILHTQYRL